MIPRAPIISAVAAVAALAGCRGGALPGASDSGFELPPRHERIDRETEAKLLRMIEDVRGNHDYLARVKAEEDLRKLLGAAPTYERPMMVRYVVQLLSAPQWGVRSLALRVLMEHGRDSPEAVAELVQVLGDMNVNAPTRNAVARTLSRWTGATLGYDAFAAAPRVEAAAKRWGRWLDETGGRIPRDPGLDSSSPDVGPAPRAGP